LNLSILNNSIGFTVLFFAVRFADKKGSAQRTTFIRKERSGLRMNGLQLQEVGDFNHKTYYVAQTSNIK